MGSPLVLLSMFGILKVIAPSDVSLKNVPALQLKSMDLLGLSILFILAVSLATGGYGSGCSERQGAG